MDSLTNNNDRLVLGTVQFGLNYGIANISGKPDQTVINNIVSQALENNIYEFDTAQGYGESEKALGFAIKQHRLKDKARIISKISLESDDVSMSSLRFLIVRSIKNLQIERLYVVMLHKEEQLDIWEDGLGQLLSLSVKEGLVKHIGVSVYTPERALQALDCKNLNIVQIPSNILDDRFLDAGVFEKADRLNKTIYIRSVFLQGLLLMKTLPEKMDFAYDCHQKVVLLAKELGVSVCELALWYVREVFPKAKIVIGVDLPEQLQKNINIWNDKNSEIDWLAIHQKVGVVPERVINPTLW